MDTTNFTTRRFNGVLSGLVLTVCASFATFQVAEANSVGGWEQSRGDHHDDDDDEHEHNGGCGGNSGLPCGITGTATFLAFLDDGKQDNQHILMKASGDHNNPTENFSIKYDLTDMIVDSATLWIWAKDDASNTTDGSGGGKDGVEKAAITKIEGASYSMAWTEINGFGTYFGFDVLSFISGSHASPLTAMLAVQNTGSKDFYFENAKLDVAYHTKPCPPPVPLPAAAWLFDSALLGFMSLSNRRKV